MDVSPDRPARVIWLVFIAGPVIWFAHFVAVYLIVEAGCSGDGPGLALFDPPVPTVATLAATAVAAAACLVFAVWGHRRWRASSGQSAAGPPNQVADHNLGGSLAFAGFLLSLLGCVAVLLVGLPALVLPAC